MGGRGESGAAPNVVGRSVPGMSRTVRAVQKHDCCPGRGNSEPSCLAATGVGGQLQRMAAGRVAWGSRPMHTRGPDFILPIEVEEGTMRGVTDGRGRELSTALSRSLYVAAHSARA